MPFKVHVDANQTAQILIKGVPFKIDLEDRERVLSRKWTINCTGGYAMSWKENSYVYLSCFVLNYSGPLDIDHLNGDVTDNRKANLAIKTRSQNMLNRHKLSSNNTSGVQGVTFYSDKPRRRPWLAAVTVEGKFTRLGTFATREEAVEARFKFDREHGINSLGN